MNFKRDGQRERRNGRWNLLELLPPIVSGLEEEAQQSNCKRCWKLMTAIKKGPERHDDGWLLAQARNATTKSPKKLPKGSIEDPRHELSGSVGIGGGGTKRWM